MTEGGVMKIPEITKRAEMYLKQINAGKNNNVDLAKHFGVTTGSAYAVTRSLVRDKIVTGKLEKLGRMRKDETIFTPTGNKYTVSDAPMRDGRPIAKRDATPVHKRVHDAFDFFIFPFAKAPEAKQ